VSSALRRPIRVEFVGIMPTLFAHCEHCMEVMHETGLKPYSEQLDEYPEDVKKQVLRALGGRPEDQGLVWWGSLLRRDRLGLTREGHSAAGTRLPRTSSKKGGSTFFPKVLATVWK